MMGLREQIAKEYFESAYPTWQWKEAYNFKRGLEKAYKFADQILSLFLEGWIVEEKCPESLKYGCGDCSGSKCNDTGIITRPALLSDLEREDVKLRRKDK